MAFSVFRRKRDRGDELLDRGWQFYTQPTTLEPVGTVFRIDGDGVRYLVDRLDVPVDQGPEAGARVVRRTEVRLGVVARFLGLIGISANAAVGRTQLLEFETQEPIRTVSHDADVVGPLARFLRHFTPEEGSRYFLIRESRSARAVTFHLSNEQIAELGGEGPVGAGLSAGASVRVGRSGTFEIAQPFPERLLVTFLPYRIAQLTAGLGAAEPQLGLAPADGPLDWREPGPPSTT